MPLTFEVQSRDPNSRARTGLITTAHGSIETPVFMPVGTRGTVKALTPDEVRDHGAQIILGNTYHLYLQPGHELIARAIARELAALPALGLTAESASLTERPAGR